MLTSARRAAAAAWLVGSAVSAGVALWLPIEELVRYTPDDAYFYLKTANNFALGLGSTFDGLHPTNGYHPLWFLILAVTFRVVHSVGISAPEELLRVTALLVSAVCVTTAWQVAGILRLVFPGVRLLPAAIATGLASVLLFVDGHFAMESCLVVLLIVLCLRARVLGASGAVSPIRALAGLFPLLFLTRIDFLSSLVPALAVLHVWEQKPNGRVKAAIRIGVPVVAVAAAYFFVNRAVFGTPVPVSATMKSTFPNLNALESLRIFAYENLTGGDAFAVYSAYSACRAFFPLVAYPLFYWQVASRSSGLLHELDKGIMACGVGALVFLLSHLAYDRDFIPPWATALPSCVALLMLVRTAVERGWAGWRVNTALGVCAAAFVLLLPYSAGRRPSGYEFARQIAEVTASSDVLFQVDASGVIGFFSGRHVINGDGLVNSVEYRDVVSGGRLRDYLRQESVDYFVSDQMVDANADIPDAPPLYREPILAEHASAVMACRGDSVVLRQREWILCRVEDASASKAVMERPVR